MRIFIIILLLFLFPLILLPIINAEEAILKDYFINNKHNWPQENDKDAYLKIKNGKYVINCINPTQATLAWIELDDLDYSKSYTIEAILKKTGGLESNSYGISWAGKDAGSHYRFEITGNGHMAIYHCEGYKIHLPLIGWLQKPEIKRSPKDNKLSIMKADRYVHFFINDKYVATLKGQFFYGNRLGFIAQPETSVEAVYFQVQQGLKEGLMSVLPYEYQEELIKLNIENVDADYISNDKMLSLQIMYSLTDHTGIQADATINLNYAIQKEDELILNESIDKPISLGEHMTLTENQISVDLAPGRYFLQVQLLYKDNLIREITRFTVK